MGSDPRKSSSVAAGTQIAVFDRRWKHYLDLLAGAGVAAFGGPSADELHARLPGDPELVPIVDAAAARLQITIALVAPDRVPDVAAGLPALQWLQSTWAGIEAMGLESIPGDVVVSRATGMFGTAMREFVLGHLLAHRLRVSARAAASSWDPTPPSLLCGERLAIAGTGEIGCAVASAALALGMEVRGFNRSGREVPPFREVVATPLELAEGSDHLVSILPETSSTRGIIDAEVLAALKPGATFINVGRGSAVAPSTVVQALAEGHLSLAVLDVLEHEPLDEGDPLWDVPGLIITSHTAAWSRPADIVTQFLANLERWQQGDVLIGMVDRARGY